jgi:hypothetical protein
MGTSQAVGSGASNTAKEAGVDNSVRLKSDGFDTIVGVANDALKRLGRPGLSKFAPADGGLLHGVSELTRRANGRHRKPGPV